MIIFKPGCGLGNQMFLYAIARVLSIKHKTELFIDKSYYTGSCQASLPKDVQRDFELDIFNIDTKEITSYENKILKRVRSRKFYKRMRAILPCVIFNSVGIKRHIIHFVEKEPQFDKSVLQLPDNLLLEGYFVSHKYFKGFHDVIVKDFSFKNSPDYHNQKLIKKISSVESVSIHIRRGDYITNKVVTERFGPCSINYYKSAATYIASKIATPRFFVFSDDPEWTRNHFKLDYPVDCVTYNTDVRNYEDLRLMSSCRHNIIANSSFSWWGAWLNQNPEKIVICPVPSFDKINIRDDDFYPESWIKLPKQTQ